MRYHLFSARNSMQEMKQNATEDLITKKLFKNSKRWGDRKGENRVTKMYLNISHF